MHFFWKSAALTACLFLVVTGSLSAEQTSKAASVNGSVITVEELDRELDLLEKRMAQQGRQLPPENMEEVRGKVLENLIDMQLLSQESKKKKITVADTAVEGQLQRFRQRYDTPEKFEAGLAQMGLTETDLKKRIRENMAVRELISREVEPTVSVSEAELRMVYEQNLSVFQQPEKIRARHILAKVESDTDLDKAREKIESVRKRLVAGEDFAKVAREESEGPSSTKGGDLGFFTRGQMVKPFADAAFSLKTGEISPIVQTEYGYHVLQVTDRQPAKALGFEEVEGKLTGLLRQQKIKAGTKKYIEQLRQSADIIRF